MCILHSTAHNSRPPLDASSCTGLYRVKTKSIVQWVNIGARYSLRFWDSLHPSLRRFRCVAMASNDVSMMLPKSLFLYSQLLHPTGRQNQWAWLIICNGSQIASTVNVGSSWLLCVTKQPDSLTIVGILLCKTIQKGIWGFALWLKCRDWNIYV